MSRHSFAISTILVLAVWASGTRSLAAAEAPPANGEPAHMLVTVEAVHGSNVPVVTREDVMVYEGRDRDKVTDWVPAQGDHAGLELVVLLDDGSNFSLGSQLEDLRQFITAQPASTKIGVAYMQNGVAKMEQNLTSDHALAAKALRLPLGIRDINGSPYFSLTDLIKRWPETTARREVLMVSDGIDLYYESGDMADPYLSAAIEDAQRAGVLVFAIYTPGVGHYGHSYWRTYWGQTLPRTGCRGDRRRSVFHRFQWAAGVLHSLLGRFGASVDPPVLLDFYRQAAEKERAAASKAKD